MVVYLRVTDSENDVHVSLVTSKTKVAPIKCLIVPWLELCGAHLLAQLLLEVKDVHSSQVLFIGLLVMAGGVK